MEKINVAGIEAAVREGDSKFVGVSRNELAALEAACEGKPPPEEQRGKAVVWAERSRLKDLLAKVKEVAAPGAKAEAQLPRPRREVKVPREEM